MPPTFSAALIRHHADLHTTAHGNPPRWNSGKIDGLDATWADARDWLTHNYGSPLDLFLDRDPSPGICFNLEGIKGLLTNDGGLADHARSMIQAGVDWLAANPKTNFLWHRDHDDNLNAGQSMDLFYALATIRTAGRGRLHEMALSALGAAMVVSNDGWDGLAKTVWFAIVPPLILPPPVFKPAVVGPAMTLGGRGAGQLNPSGAPGDSASVAGILRRLMDAKIAGLDKMESAISTRSTYDAEANGQAAATLDVPKPSGPPASIAAAVQAKLAAEHPGITWASDPGDGSTAPGNPTGPPRADAGACTCDIMVLMAGGCKCGGA